MNTSDIENSAVDFLCDLFYTLIKSYDKKQGGWRQAG